MIPKVLHRIWLGQNPKPDNYQRNLDTFISLHPDWEIMEWNDNNLPTLTCKLEFKMVPGIVWKADVLKREVLNLYPGIYADHDLVFLRNMDDLLDRDDFLVATSPHTVAAFIYGHGPNGTFVPGSMRYFPGAFMARQMEHQSGSYAGSSFLNELWNKRYSHIERLPRVLFMPGMAGDIPENPTAESLPDSYAYHTNDGLGR
jgi:mannosyltransferase OCH1-like enzyme